jgi:hypothetical protein
MAQSLNKIDVSSERGSFEMRIKMRNYKCTRANGYRIETPILHSLWIAINVPNRYIYSIVIESSIAIESILHIEVLIQ